MTLQSSSSKALNKYINVILLHTVTFHYFRTFSMTSMHSTRHPQDNANFLSKILLWWIFPLLRKGTHDPLTHEDLFAIKEVERSCQRTSLLEEKWRQEVKSARASVREPKLWRAMSRYFTFREYWYFAPSGFVYFLGDNITWFSTIRLLRELISFDGDASRDDCFVFVYGIAMGTLMKLIGQNHFHLHGAILGVRARAAIVGSLYRKVRIHWTKMEGSPKINTAMPNRSQLIRRSISRVCFLIRVLPR